MKLSMISTNTHQGSFIPVTLESLARERGFLESDRSIPCSASRLPDLDNPHNPGYNNGQCVVSILGRDINTASFAMYTFSISVLLQAIVVITFSGAADHGQYRKTLLLTFAIIGAISTMLFLPVTGKWFLFAALWAIIGNVCCASTFVLLNSFLPLLVRYHPSRRSRGSQAQSEVSLQFDFTSFVEYQGRTTWRRSWDR